LEAEHLKKFMTTPINTTYLIVGAGIAGLSLGIGLFARDINFVILEKSILVDGIGAGLGITSNAIVALDTFGMAEKIKSIAKPLASLR
jgi:2-polyprenyl-6-methoxyphenol hydroxylase-like FAD-dependent oxidoreductase